MLRQMRPYERTPEPGAERMSGKRVFGSADEMQKQRVLERRVGYRQTETLGDAKLLASAPRTPAYATGREAYRTDMANVLADEQRSKRERHEVFLARRRAERTRQEQARRDAAIGCRASPALAERSLPALASARPARRNAPGIAYDFISEGYSANQDGLALSRADERARTRWAARANALAARTSSGFNPITGAALAPVQAPATTLPAYRLQAALERKAEHEHTQRARAAAADSPAWSFLV